MSCLVVAFSAASFGVCTGHRGTPKEVVGAFYKLGLQELEVKEAFARYMSPDFVEHATSSAGGQVQSTVEFLSNLARQSPPPRWEIVRTIAEADLVFLHVRVTTDKGPPLMLGEIFRVHDGKIVEHWDILQPVPEHPINPNSPF